MTDPRIEATPSTSKWTTTDIRMLVEWFDAKDAAAGVVRVDTRNPATARRLHFAVAAYMYSDTRIADCVRAVLVALTEEQPS